MIIVDLEIFRGWLCSVLHHGLHPEPVDAVELATLSVQQNVSGTIHTVLEQNIFREDVKYRNAHICAKIVTEISDRHGEGCLM